MRTDHIIILFAVVMLALSVYFAVLALTITDTTLTFYTLIGSTALFLSGVFLLVFMTVVLGSKKMLLKPK